jgi:hypothetical protein
VVSKHSKKNKSTAPLKGEPVDPSIDDSAIGADKDGAESGAPGTTDDQDSIDAIIASLLAAGAEDDYVRDKSAIEAKLDEKLESDFGGSAVVAQAVAVTEAVEVVEAAGTVEAVAVTETVTVIEAPVADDADGSGKNIPEEAPGEEDGFRPSPKKREDHPAGSAPSASEAAFSPAIEEEDRIVEPQILGLPPKRPVWPLVISAIVVLILLTGGITFYNKTTLANQAAEVAAIQDKGDLLLDESIALIQEADSVIVALDKATEDQVTEADIPKLEALLDQLESTQHSLVTAGEKSEQAKAIYVDEERQGLAQHAQDAAEYRKQMLDLSNRLVGYDIAAFKSAQLIDQAWTLIVEADADMRSAVEAVAVGGGDAVGDSRDYNQSAVDKLGQAGEKLASATEIFSELNLQVLTDYLVVKKESAQLALDSDQAYLDGYYYDANTLNDEFYAKDAEAVELAANIPSNPLSLVVSTYDEAVTQLREEYAGVRSKAADADAFLRAYLGVDIQVDVGTA